MLSDLLPLLKAYFFDSTMDKTLEGKTYLEYLVEQTNLPMISVRDCVNDHFVEYSNLLEQTFQIRIYSTTVRKEEWAIHSRLVNDISSTLQNYDLEMITGGMANVGIAEENEGGLSDEAYAAQLQQWIDEGTVLRDIERREKGWTFDAIIHNIPNGQDHVSPTSTKIQTSVTKSMSSITVSNCTTCVSILRIGEGLLRMLNTKLGLKVSSSKPILSRLTSLVA